MYTHVYTFGFCVSIVLNTPTHPCMHAHAHTHAHTHTHTVLYTRNLQYITFFEALDGVANALDNVDASESVIVSCMYTIGCYIYCRILYSCVLVV